MEIRNWELEAGEHFFSDLTNKSMAAIFRLGLLIAGLMLLGVACGGRAAPPLAESGWPTLVFVFTDG